VVLTRRTAANELIVVSSCLVIDVLVLEVRRVEVRPTDQWVFVNINVNSDTVHQPSTLVQASVNVGHIERIGLLSAI